MELKYTKFYISNQIGDYGIMVLMKVHWISNLN